LLHPAVYLSAWFVLLVVAQFFSASTLLLMLGLPLLAGHASLARWWLLLRRSRWLLLTLVLVIAYSVPGHLLGGMAWAPSYEGLEAAAQQLLFLVLVLGSLAVLLTRMSRENFLLALWALCRIVLPPSWADRSVTRLALVFEYVDQPSNGGWRALLAEPEDALISNRELTLRVLPWRVRDVLVLVLVSAAATALVLVL